jgi:hypothetical protein
LAQFNTIPLQQIESQTPQKLSAARKTAGLSLPFFDDFSTSTNRQNLNKWQKGGGVYINNTFTTNHPTLNVATFDGLKADGNPYNFYNPLAQGETDSLSSLSIDLSQYQLKDSLYLSFFYTKQGLGERPDATDSLRLQFLTNGAKWETVWIDSGKVISDKFIQVLIPIRKSVYLHGDFKFSFQAFGRQSGQFDVWHLDYIYLDKNRTNKDIYTQDIACRNPISPILKRYNAMPMRQLLVNPTAEFAETIQSDIFNLFRNQNIVTFKYSVKNLLTNQLLQDDSSKVNVQSVSSQVIELKNNLANLIKGDKAQLKLKFDVKTGDSPAFSINDTISRTVTLDNFYAYDDGTAEQAAYLKKGFGRATVQFVLNKPDAVTAIRINLQPTVTDLTGKRITFQILANDKGKPGRILKTISDTTTVIKYPNSPNTFIEYKIDSVAVVDTFYVGYVQLTDDEPLTIGLDVNSTQFSNRSFYNISNEWVNVTDAQKTSTFVPIRGSLMIRPVMAGKEIIPKPLATEEEIQEKNLVISPNPSAGIFKWNDSSLKNVEIFDMIGRSIFQEKTESQEVNLQNLNTGTYLLRLSNDKNSFVRKIVKE